MRTANPALQAFTKAETLPRETTRTMTLGGTVTAAAILTGLCAVTAVTTYGWMASTADRGTGIAIGLGGMAIGLVLALIMSFAPRTAPFCSPVYAIAEGAFVGVLSWLIPVIYNKAPEGIILQALLLTFGILFVLLAAYATGLVRIGGTAARVIMIATSGVALYYLAVMVMNFMGMGVTSLGWSTNPYGIGFSVIVVVLASLNLVLDFQLIEDGIKNRAPRYMEWYGGFALLVTLVWLYIEALRLLAKLKER